MSHRLRDSIIAMLFSCAGCRSQSVDPAPPPATFELAVAAPGARGARAAGTDAAPPAPREGELNDPGVEPDPEPEPEAEPEESDAGESAQGGAQAVPTPGVAL